jgi:hypothetical protein
MDKAALQFTTIVLTLVIHNTHTHIHVECYALVGKKDKSKTTMKGDMVSRSFVSNEAYLLLKCQLKSFVMT